MARPVIGILANFFDERHSKAKPHNRLNAAYADSVAKAGGLPLILPVLEAPDAIDQFLDAADAVLFGGGYDIDPARFGQPRHPRTQLLADRLDAFLFAVFDRMDRRADLPALGICLGCQLFNVARGGTLHQHLNEVHRPQPIDHVCPQVDQYAGGRAHHVIRIEPSSRLAEALGGRTEIHANSGHHQAVDRLGRGLVVSARSGDGVVEAVEDPSRPFFIAVQYHPEDLSDQPEHLAIFQSLVAAARARARSRV